MKSQETKDKFILLRAENKSHNTIAKELGIAKGTCVQWDKEFKEQIAELKRENLQALYDNYGLAKEARIQALGETLERINTALEEIDLVNVHPAQLLAYKLKYQEALKAEYIPLESKTSLADKQELTAPDIMEAVKDLLARVQAGEITQEQAGKESLVLSNLLRAYENTVLESKVDHLTHILESRG